MQLSLYDGEVEATNELTTDHRFFHKQAKVHIPGLSFMERFKFNKCIYNTSLVITFGCANW
jgi:hypothetical protein